MQTRGGGELLRFGDFVATGPVVEVVVTPWWQEMVEGRRKWSVVACQVAEIRGNPVVARPKIEGPRRCPKRASLRGGSLKEVLASGC